MDLGTAIKWLHVIGNVFWIGAIAAVGMLILSKAGDAKTRGELALEIYKKVAVPGFVLSFALGFARLMMDTSFYLREHHWMHGKLVFAVVAIGLHHVIGARAKKLANGETKEPGPTKVLLAVFAVSAIAALFFVVFRLPD